MPHIYVELIRDSRAIENARTGFTQDFVMDLCLDPTINPVFEDAEFLGYTDDIVALEYAYTIFPEVRKVPDYSGAAGAIILQSIRVEEKKKWVWRATAQYVYNVNTGTGGSRPDPTKPPPQDQILPYVKIGFNIGQGTKTVMKTPEKPKLGPELRNGSLLPDPPDPCFLGVIGLTEDGGISGIEVPDATFRLQITAYYFPSVITVDFAKELAEVMRGKWTHGSYNDAEFLGFPEGEMSLVGISGGGTVVDVIPLTFDFSIARNLEEEPDEGFSDLTMIGQDVLDYTFINVFDDGANQAGGGAKKILLHPEVRTVHRIRSPEDYKRLQLPIGVTEENN